MQQQQQPKTRRTNSVSNTRSFCWLKTLRPSRSTGPSDFFNRVTRSSSDFSALIEQTLKSQRQLLFLRVASIELLLTPPPPSAATADSTPLSTLFQPHPTRIHVQ